MELPDHFQISDTLLCFDTTVRKTRLGREIETKFRTVLLTVKIDVELGSGFFAVFVRCKNRGGMGSGPKGENTQRFFTNGVGNWSQLLIPRDTMTSSRSLSQAMTATEILWT